MHSHAGPSLAKEDAHLMLSGPSLHKVWSLGHSVAIIGTCVRNADSGLGPELLSQNLHLLRLPGDLYGERQAEGHGYWECLKTNEARNGSAISKAVRLLSLEAGKTASSQRATSRPVVLRKFFDPL